MEKITGKFIGEFIERNEILLLATQNKLCVPVIDRLCQKMWLGIKFDDIRVCDNLIIEGHHRYISSLITNFNLGQVSSQKTSATKPVDWKLIEFDENDWDTSSKILHLNKQDALYNNLDIEFVNQLTSR